jgi:hypothetical protein
MGVKLVSASGGSVEINPPATASSFTATMPAGTGNVVVAGINSAIVSGTAQASTSGTSIDFTGIPSWVRRVTVMFNGVSTNGTSSIQLQIGTSSGVVSTGYLSHSGFIQSSAVGSSVATTGYVIVNAVASDVLYGPFVITTTGSNVWNASGSFFRDASTDYSIISTGTITLGGTLDRVRITTVNGTDAFDAGSINILYE